MTDDTDPDALAPPVGEDGTSQILTVSEVNRLVKDLLEQTLYPVWIQAEVGNCTIHSSGHVYLTLKDNGSQLSAVYFRGASAARAMKLQTGMEVEVYGKLSVFEPRGQYQLMVRHIRAGGIGTLQARFDELKKRLAAEGLFDADRKRPIPKLPTCVGVVTSADGAALRDFLSVIRRRYAGMHVRIAPCAVQGAGAAEQIADAIATLNEKAACDVIVVTRGGGSLEDLWAFNEEVVARAVAASAIPVVSAVGHEVDFSICDFTADLRVPTPSAAAELVVGTHAEFVDRVANLRRRANSQVGLRLSELRSRVQAAAGHYVFREPMNLVRMYQQRVDEAQMRIGHSLERRVVATRDRTARADTRLRLLNPRSVLARGYAILLDPDRTPVTDAAGVTPGTPLRAVLHTGDLDLTVTATHSEPDAD